MPCKHEVIDSSSMMGSKKFMDKRPKITHVAIRFEGMIYSLPAPNRHHDVIMHLSNTLNVSYIDVFEDDKGFLDASGQYLTRKQAYYWAKDNNQILNLKKAMPGHLTSEDLW